MKSPHIVINGGEPAEIALGTNRRSAIDLEVSGGVAGGEEFDGPYTITPGEDPSVLKTNNKQCTQNIIVKPIPSNYGRIDWNGTTLTVY